MLKIYFKKVLAHDTVEFAPSLNIINNKDVWVLKEQQQTNIRLTWPNNNDKEILWSVPSNSNISQRRQISSGPSSEHLGKNNSEVQRRSNLEAYQDFDIFRIQLRQNKPIATLNMYDMD